MRAKCPGCGQPDRALGRMAWYGEHVMRCSPCIHKNEAYKGWARENPPRVLVNGEVLLQEDLA